jgi:hypothetical protein
MKNHKKYSLQNIIVALFTLIITAILSSCTRPIGPISHVSITLPKSSKSLKIKNVRALGNVTECYAVSISGPGIEDNPRTCGPATGITAGFAGAGETLSLEVPSGNDRVVSVYLYYASPGETSCPSWDGSFDDPSGKNYNYTFKLVDIPGVSLHNSVETIPITVTDPTPDMQPVRTQLDPDALASCSHPAQSISHVSITLPKTVTTQSKNTFTQSSLSKGTKFLNRKGMSALGVPTECYAVSISGPGIEDNPRTCGPTTGIIAGFAASGETLTLDVPTGSDRVVSVYLYYTSPGQTSCPSWSIGFDDSFGINYLYTYKLAESAGITLRKTEESISISVMDPSMDALPVLTQLGMEASCIPVISSYLNSDGTITDTDGNPIPALLSEAPIAESFSLLMIGDLSLSSLIINSTSSVFFSPAGDVKPPTYLKSIVKHPIDNTKVVGLRDDGILEEVSLSDGSSTEFTTTTCPFFSCEVPPWLKSITLGPDKNLYGLDHGGGFYLLSDTDPLIMTEVIVPEYVEQVAF